MIIATSKDEILKGSSLEYLHTTWTERLVARWMARLSDYSICWLKEVPPPFTLLDDQASPVAMDGHFCRQSMPGHIGAGPPAVPSNYCADVAYQEAQERRGR